MKFVSSFLLLLLINIKISYCEEVIETDNEEGSNDIKKDNLQKSRNFGPFHEIKEEKTNEAKDIFLPVDIDDNGKINGVLLEDTDPDKGPIVIEEILDSEGNVKEVKIERINDVIKNYENRSKIGRKIGPMKNKDYLTSQTIEKNNSTFEIIRLLFFILFVFIFLMIILYFITIKYISYIMKMPNCEKMRIRSRSLYNNDELPKHHNSYNFYADDDESICGTPVKSPVRSPKRRSSYCMDKNIKLSSPF